MSGKKITINRWLWDPLPALLLLLLFSVVVEGQAAYLYPHTPLKSQIIDGKPKYFTIQLLSDQTATVEVDQSDIDASLAYFDPAGNRVLQWGMPLGRVGTETILVIAKTPGDYRVEVSTGNRHAASGSFVVKITDIRQTTDDDRTHERVAKEISALMIEADRLRDEETGASYRKAIEVWKRVIDLSKIKRDNVAEARALHALGNLYLDFGEIQPSLDVNLQAIQMWRTQKNRRMELVAAGRIGNIWLQIGEYEKAVIQYNEVLRISREIGSGTNEAAILGNIGMALLAMEKPQEAITYFEKALTIYGDLKLPLLEPQMRQNLGRAYIALGDYRRGLDSLKNALDLQEKVGFRIDTPPFYLVLGKVYQESGETDKAFDLFFKAKTLALETGTQRYAVQSLYYLALIESGRGNYSKAIEHLDGGLSLIEKTRGEIRSKDLRTSYFSTVQNYYELYIDLLIQRSVKENNADDVALAFEMSESSRSRSLIDLLHEANVDLKRRIRPKLLEKQNALIDELNNKYRVREGLLTSRSKPEQIERVDAEINDLLLGTETVNIQIGKENPRYADLYSGKRPSVKDLQDLLDNETVFLEYKLGEKRSYAWLVNRSSIKVFQLPSRRTIEDKAKTFYDLVVANRRVDQAAISKVSTELSELLLSPVGKEIAGKRIAIVADGVLQYTPFSALPNPRSSSAGTDTLNRTNEVIFLPSASVLAQLRAHPNRLTPHKKSIAIFADPVFDLGDARIHGNPKSMEKNTALAGVLRDLRLGETLPRLLASRQEARNIAEMVNGDADVKTDFQANLSNIETSDLRDYRVLHFATHGLLNSSRPELSGLVFSLYDEKGNVQDGFLGLNDVYNLDLSSDLVILSACQSALGKEVRGEGLIGLSRGFLYAGSKRIVASLWKVDDSATAEFMKLFYKNHLQKGMSASSALRAAKLELQKIPRYRSPYYWSAFTLLGDWR